MSGRSMAGLSLAGNILSCCRSIYYLGLSPCCLADANLSALIGLVAEAEPYLKSLSPDLKRDLWSSR